MKEFIFTYMGESFFSGLENRNFWYDDIHNEEQLDLFQGFLENFASLVP